ncbi:MAG: hypothetical protein DGJ47_000901 [Rickettsiaceae bacterium]
MSSIKNNITNLQNSKEKKYVWQILNNNFMDNITNDISSKLANLIIIDHFHRMNSTPSIVVHLQKCVDNLSSYLKHRVIEEGDFSSIMTLFAVAISDNKVDEDEEERVLFESQDIIIDSLITAHYPDIDQDLFSQMRVIFADIANFLGPVKLIDSVAQNPTLLKHKVQMMVKEKGQRQEMIHNTAQELNQQINIKNLKSLKRNRTSNIAVKAVLSFGVIGAVPLFLTLGSLAIPTMFVVPPIALSYASDSFPKFKSWLKNPFGNIPTSEDISLTKVQNSQEVGMHYSKARSSVERKEASVTIDSPSRNIKKDRVSLTGKKKSDKVSKSLF